MSGVECQSKMTKAICLIPARMGSSRFPGKPLAPLLGYPLILHILERCRLCTSFNHIAVATCDEEIRDCVVAAKGMAILTSPDHERATDRVEEAISHLNVDLNDDDFVLMVQGDEILVSPEMVAKMLSSYEESPSPVVNLVTPLYSEADIEDVNTVKVVGTEDGRAIYFSRSPIPSRVRDKDAKVYQQTGIIGFSYSFLRQFALLPPTRLEATESVDMLRVIEHGYHIQLIYSDVETIGVDTPGDLKRAEERLKIDPRARRYGTLQ